jgi:hypothetical protein
MKWPQAIVQVALILGVCSCTGWELHEENQVQIVRAQSGCK